MLSAMYILQFNKATFMQLAFQDNGGWAAELVFSTSNSLFCYRLGLSLSYNMVTSVLLANVPPEEGVWY